MKLLLLLSTLLWSANAQLTDADYQRANGLREKLQSLAINMPGQITWIGQMDRFWYRKTVAGGHAFVVVDAESLKKNPAFDHEAIAAALTSETREKYTAVTLPFSEFQFIDEQHAIEFTAGGSEWRCEVAASTCRKLGATGFGRGGRPPEEDSPAEYGNDVEDGMVSPQAGQNGSRGGNAPQATSKPSPNGHWEALIQNYNVFLREKGSKQAEPLSWDGSEGNYYTLASIAWSPDSTHLAAYRVRPGYRREVHYVESSPADQLQPKHSTRQYAKPGDVVDIAQPMLFDVAAKHQMMVDNTLFPNPYSLSPPVWRQDSRAFTFEYNQRGHQVYRVIEVTAALGDARTVIQPHALITEESKTFIDYRPLVANPRDTGKKFRFDVNGGSEMIWASERDGWEHLYMLEPVTGRLNQDHQGRLGGPLGSKGR